MADYLGRLADEDVLTLVTLAEYLTRQRLPGNTLFILLGRLSGIKLVPSSGLLANACHELLKLVHCQDRGLLQHWDICNQTMPSQISLDTVLQEDWPCRNVHTMPKTGQG